MIKKTSLDRNMVAQLYCDIDMEFAKSLLDQGCFPFIQLPRLEDIDVIITEVEKQYLSKRLCWSSCQDDLLNIIVLGTCLKYHTFPVELTPSQWEIVSKMFKYHNWKACRNRWLSERHQKAPWTADEDKLLMELHVKYPNKWCEIAIELMKKCQTPYIRQGKQCRDRWVNKLDPNIINLPWHKEEELRLFQEVRRRGKKWAEISLRVFKLRRTENTIKNRFYNLLKQEENRLRMSRVPKEEKDYFLIDSIIEGLQEQLNHVEKISLSKSRAFMAVEWNVRSTEIRELIVIKGKKLCRLSDIDLKL